MDMPLSIPLPAAALATTGALLAFLAVIAVLLRFAAPREAAFRAAAAPLPELSEDLIAWRIGVAGAGRPVPPPEEPTLRDEGPGPAPTDARRRLWRDTSAMLLVACLAVLALPGLTAGLGRSGGSGPAGSPLSGAVLSLVSGPSASPAPGVGPSPLAAPGTAVPAGTPSPAPETTAVPGSLASPSASPVRGTITVPSTPRPAPRATPRPTPRPTATPVPSATPSPSPDVSPSPAASASPGPSPTPGPTASPAPTASASSDPSPSPASPTPDPSPSPSPAPSGAVLP